MSDCVELKPESLGARDDIDVHKRRFDQFSEMPGVLFGGGGGRRHSAARKAGSSTSCRISTAMRLIPTVLIQSYTCTCTGISRRDLIAVDVIINLKT